MKTRFCTNQRNTCEDERCDCQESTLEPVLAQRTRENKKVVVSADSQKLRTLNDVTNAFLYAMAKQHKGEKYAKSIFTKDGELNISGPKRQVSKPYFYPMP